jgi:hypothetical protein
MFMPLVADETPGARHPAAASKKNILLVSILILPAKDIEDLFLVRRRFSGQQKTPHTAGLSIAGQNSRI